MGEVVYYIGVDHARPGYDTVALWQTATQIDIVASGVTSGEAIQIIGELVHPTGDYDEDGLTFTGATTDVVSYRILRAGSSGVHAGVRGSGATIYSDIGGFGAVLNINENFFRLEDVQVKSNGAAVQYGIVVNTAVSGVEVSGAIVYECAYGGVSFQGSGIATNCIVHHTAANNSVFGAFQGDSGDTGKFTARHCTALAETTDNNKSTTGFRYLTAHNCISMHYGGTAGHKDFLNLRAGSQNNCSSDDSADDWSSPGLPTQVATDVFVNVTSGSSTDLHILSTAGVVASGSGLSASVPTDIDGDAFHVSTPSIGADQWVNAAFTGTIVNDADADLVALYRFENYVADGYLTNRSQAPAYSVYNNMDTSGTIPQAATVPALLPSGSGASFDSFGDIFHSHSSGGGGSTPQSGFDVSTTTPFSFGFWGMPTAWTNDRSWFAKWSSATSGNYYRLQASETSDNLHWSLSLGVSNGTSQVVIENTSISMSSGVYEFVCATVDPATSTAILYVSGIPVASSISLTYSPGPSGIDIVDVPMRLGAHRGSTNMGAVNSVGSPGGDIANAFFMKKELTQLEVSGIYQSGFAEGAVAAVTGVSDSNVNDSLKDNVGELSSAVSTIIMTAWDPTDLANPSGSRHATSGFHPAFINELGLGSVSGLNFGTLLQGTSSGTKAIVFRNNTPGTNINNMRLWQKDYAALGAAGWNVAVHINSKWLNLTLPSGSGILGKTLDSAISVLRSDLGTTISGYNIDGTALSGEEEVSQYIYLAFNADTELSPGTYGPDGFGFRLTVDNA